MESMGKQVWSGTPIQDTIQALSQHCCPKHRLILRIPKPRCDRRRSVFQPRRALCTGRRSTVLEEAAWRW